MLSIKSLSATAVALSLLTAVPANAQGMGYGPGMGAFGNTNGAVLVDGNNDGVVSADEAAAHWSSHFMALDSDDDGAMSEDEYMDGAPTARGGRLAVQRLFVNRTARFAAMDGNGDKSISRAEHMAEAQAAYTEADTNGDGIVTVWEYRAAHRPF